MSRKTPPTQVIQAPLHVNQSVFLEATAITRPQLVYQHMHAAALFSCSVSALEAQHAGHELDPRQRHGEQVRHLRRQGRVREGAARRGARGQGRGGAGPVPRGSAALP